MYWRLLGGWCSRLLIRLLGRLVEDVATRRYWLIRLRLVEDIRHLEAPTVFLRERPRLGFVAASLSKVLLGDVEIR